MFAANGFLKETWIYAARVRSFQREDWLSYMAWVGMIFGLSAVTGGFLWVGHQDGVSFPDYVWSIPGGALIFAGAIAFDTIGHRTVYKAELAKGEALVHHITIFAGITSCLLLCLGYHLPGLLRFPILTFVVLSVFYSVIDEALHWRRYVQGHSDRVEMWSHFFIFVGHLIMILAWFHWYEMGYPGVADTLERFAF